MRKTWATAECDRCHEITKTSRKLDGTEIELPLGWRLMDLQYQDRTGANRRWELCGPCALVVAEHADTKPEEAS